MNRIVVGDGVFCDPDRELPLIRVDGRDSDARTKMDTRQNQCIDTQSPEMRLQVGIGKGAEELFVDDGLIGPGLQGSRRGVSGGP
jgi:hypothetical protein